MATGMATPLWRVWKAWLIINWGPLKFTNESRPSPLRRCSSIVIQKNILHPLHHFANGPLRKKAVGRASTPARVLQNPLSAKSSMMVH